jgi:hypothetical protein
MSNNSAFMMKLIGIALLVGGMGLAYWGYEISESLSSRITETFTGSPRDKVMLLYIGGVVSFVVGLMFFVKK